MSVSTREFFWTAPTPQEAESFAAFRGHRLSDEILLANARLFIVLRWVIASSFLLFHLIAHLAPRLLYQHGIDYRGQWALWVGVLLYAANTVFALILRKRNANDPRSLGVNITLQMLVDLLCLTVVVYYLGSIGTPAPFFYVLHISLSCILFSVRASLGIVALVCLLYDTCLLLQATQPAFGAQGVLVDVAAKVPHLPPSSIILWALSLNVLFVLVWHVVSHLTVIIRAREHQLIQANDRIRHTQEEKDRYAVQMTHQLKAPLDAIRSNIKLLLGGYCGAIDEEARILLARCDARANGMGQLVMDVLKLTQFRDTAANTDATLIALADMTRRCIERLQGFATARDITIDAHLEDCVACRGAPHIELLLENLITNAITYSHPGSTITVRCGPNPANHHATISVADCGIGIDEESLPHIFDEYFSSALAKKHNTASSGIGLSIVKSIAQAYNLRIRVQSAPAAGTTFTVTFPPASHSRAPVEAYA